MIFFIGVVFILIGNTVKYNECVDAEFKSKSCKTQYLKQYEEYGKK